MKIQLSHRNITLHCTLILITTLFFFSIIQSGLTANQVITIENNMISAKLVETPLIEALKHIEQKSGFILHTYGDLTEPVTIILDSQPLEQGLLRLIGNHSLSLVYHPIAKPEPDNISKRISEVWVFSKKDHGERKFQQHFSENSTLLPFTSIAIPENLKEKTEEEKILFSTRLLNDVNTTHSNKMLATKILTEIGNSESLMAMAAFLGSDDRELRNLIVYGIGEIDDERSIQTLGQVMYGDPDPEIRMTAIKALARRQDHITSTILLTDALNDPEPEVRELAKRLLNH